MPLSETGPGNIGSICTACLPPPHVSPDPPLSWSRGDGPTAPCPHPALTSLMPHAPVCHTVKSHVRCCSPALRHLRTRSRGPLGGRRPIPIDGGQAYNSELPISVPQARRVATEGFGDGSTGVPAAPPLGDEGDPRVCRARTARGASRSTDPPQAVRSGRTDVTLRTDGTTPSPTSCHGTPPPPPPPALRYTSSVFRRFCPHRCFPRRRYVS